MPDQWEEGGGGKDRCIYAYRSQQQIAARSSQGEVETTIKRKSKPEIRESGRLTSTLIEPRAKICASAIEYLSCSCYTMRRCRKGCWSFDNLAISIFILLVIKIF